MVVVLDSFARGFDTTHAVARLMGFKDDTSSPYKVRGSDSGRLWPAVRQVEACRSGRPNRPWACAGAWPGAAGHTVLRAGPGSRVAQAVGT
ncbi:hypothetical protein COLO4_24720 [Corchorus olitorius]|uniref:Uncharacterized protein n=1 Tax=Corchorus olitorius TaxID=93759 RepID=A0A1R3I7Q7_9ROSI|nr:hypothetical protein COLO4_24720 [Corchorus olitorius]